MSGGGRDWARVHAKGKIHQGILKSEREGAERYANYVPNLLSDDEKVLKANVEESVKLYEGDHYFLLNLKKELAKPGMRYLSRRQVEVASEILRQQAVTV